jgi:hypothetical protein
MTIDEVSKALRAAMGQGTMLIESIVDGKPVGGEGVIVEVYWGNDWKGRYQLWVAVDWGMAWIVTADGFKLEPVAASAT